MEQYGNESERALNDVSIERPMERDFRAEQSGSKRLSRRAQNASSDLARKAKENPMPITGALLAAGVGWLLWRTLRGASHNRSERHQRSRWDRQGSRRGRGYTGRSQGRGAQIRDYGWGHESDSDYGNRSSGRVNAFRQDDDFDSYGGYNAYRTSRDDRQDYGLSNYGQRNYGYRYGYGDRYGYGQQDFGDSDYLGYGTGYSDYGSSSLGRYGSDAYDVDDWDYGLGSGYGQSPSDYNWSYSELWLIPGPHSGRGPEGYQRASERIQEDAHDRLTEHGGVDASDIQVRVDNGEITLEGTVDSRRSKRLAEEAVEDVFGVKDVHNRLKVQSRTGSESDS